MQDELKFDEETAKLEYDKINRKHLIITRSTCNLRFSLPILNWHFMFWLSRNPDVRTLGISNLTADGQWCAFFDYDNIFRYRVIDEMQKLQRDKDFQLGTAVVLTTKTSYDRQGKEYGSFHCIAVSKWKSLFELQEMLRQTSVDEQFVRVPDFFNGRYNVLRVFPKEGADGKMLRGRPVLRDILPAVTSRELSTAHVLFLEKYYGVPYDVFEGRQDGNTVLKTVKYFTTEGSRKQEVLKKLGLR
jgi:hypothetical protein